MSKQYDYDAIIIGAGISGLVCGCYLAKAGLRTIIIEKNFTPGGYCTSFTRNGFSFDACVYALSSYRKGGILRRLSEELNLNTRLKLVRHNISDIIITPRHKVSLHSSKETTLKELQIIFPLEKKGLADFFALIMDSSTLTLSKLRKVCFNNILNSFFSNPELKTILSIVLLGYTGIPPSQLSAFVGALIYREFIFDGGYYPYGGIQQFPNTLADKFIQLGGKIMYSSRAKEIVFKHKTPSGVTLANQIYIPGKIIVSACDAHETFLNLIKPKYLPYEYICKFKKMRPSLSAFLVYLGLNSPLPHINELKSHTWIINKNFSNIEKIYSNALHNKFDFVAVSSTSMKNPKPECINKSTVFLYTNASFISKSFWTDSMKEKLSAKLISMASILIPDLSTNINAKITASPVTLYKWTMNYRGACYGWANTKSQFLDPMFSENSKIKNLYITGHWSNKSSGVTSVINSAIKTAENIIHSKK